MPKFNFYLQERNDGGVRAGITLDEDEYWHMFEPGSTDDDSALRWYIDVRGEGDAVPADSAELHQWLSCDEVVSAIRTACDVLAGRVATGIDHDGWPVQQEVTDAPDGVQMRLVASAIRRVDSLQIASIVRRFGTQFPEILERLHSVNQVA